MSGSARGGATQSSCGNDTTNRLKLVVAPAEVIEMITRLTSPSPTDVLRAREVILDCLADAETHHERDLIAKLAGLSGVESSALGEQVTVSRTADGWSTLTGKEPAVVWLRSESAIREGLAALAREGVIMATVGTMHREAARSIPLRRVDVGHVATGSASMPDRSPALPSHRGDCRWKLVENASSPRFLLARTSIVDGLEDLLGHRGIEVLREAVLCAHHGRFIAAVDLLAAASEAAWFGVGLAAVGRDNRLDQLVASGDGAANVIERTFNLIAVSNALSTAVRNDVRAQAARFRDLRNYGLHPVGEPDADRELAFTEAGCATLFMTARRYFAHLDSARLAFVATPDIVEEV